MVYLFVHEGRVVNKVVVKLLKNKVWVEEFWSRDVGTRSHRYFQALLDLDKPRQIRLDGQDRVEDQNQQSTPYDQQPEPHLHSLSVSHLLC